MTWGFLISPRCTRARSAPITATAASVLARAPALAGRTRVIHHGLGPRFRYGRRPRRPVILCVGSLNRHKNLPVIAAAFGQICRQNPEYTLVVVGAPRQVLSSPEPALRALAALPPDRVQMRGHVSEEELLDLYNEAAVLVHAALMEGYGAVPLEAMACGCPTVLSDIPALRELCGGAALFFDPHNPAVLADAMQRVIGDPALQEQLRAAGLRQAAQHTWRRCAEQTLEVILGGEGHGAGRSAAGEAEAARGGAANSPCIRG
jgi:glycosyltransferase involved in cell wall biosynthesis